MLSLIFGPPRPKLATVSSSYGWWPTTGRVKTVAGVEVDEQLALTYSGVFACTRILTEGTAALPLRLYRRNDGEPEEARDKPQYRLTIQPNPEMPFGVFKIGRTMHQINSGNGFAEIERERFGDPSSRPVNLWPIHAARVRPPRTNETDSRGRLLPQTIRYLVRNNDGSEMAMHGWEMLHVPGVLSEDGIWGKSIVSNARQEIGAGIAMVRHGANVFGSGKQPPAVIFGAGLRDAEARRQFRREWKEMHGSPDSGEIAILASDAKYQAIGISNEAAQYLESQGFSIENMARFYRVPLHMLARAMAAGYNGIIQLSEEFVRYSLVTWLELWEEQCNQKLLTEEERQEYFYKHDFSGILKADPETRAKIREINIRSGFWTINDSKRSEGEPGIGPAGDLNYVMTNMTTAQRIYEGLPPPAAMKEGDGGMPAKAGRLEGQKTSQIAEAEPQSLLSVPDIRQEGDYDCGAAATSAVAQFYDVDEGRTEDDFIAELGTTVQDGTPPEAIIDWFNDQGLVTTSGQGMTVDDLREFFEDDIPVICLMQLQGTTPQYDQEEEQNRSGHWVTVNGVGLGMVFYMDPLAGQCMMDEAEWTRRWHDQDDDDADQLRINERFGIAVKKDWSTDDEQEEEADIPPPELPERSAGGDKQGSSTSPDGERAANDGAPPRLKASQHGYAGEEPVPPAGSSLLALPQQGSERAAQVKAARAILEDTFGRLFLKEQKAAEPFANPNSHKKHRLGFDGWLAEFYPKQKELMARALAPVLPLLECLSIKVSAISIADAVCAESVTEISLAYDAPGKNAAQSFLDTIRKWPGERASAVTERILRGELK